MRERENVRERSPDSLGRVRNQVKSNGWMSRNDFRDGLVSIFIDNLSPSVASMGLWRFFKSFGKVRDVYLPSKKSLRGSRFGFIRFESAEEAANVAMKVNGMVIEGQTVSAKVASYGWNRRRSVDSKVQSVKGDVFLPIAENDFRGGRSFANVVAGNRRIDEKVPTMEWKLRNSDHEWLNKCAAGVLSKFSGVTRVNKRLLNRGLKFSSSYVGDKCILWSFDSVSDKEDFIKSRFLWDDCFSSMVNWSDILIPQSRVVWILCSGIPLHLWNHDFFKKLGWTIGEPLLVEDDMVLRNRLDRGRILVLIPGINSVPCAVKVEMEIGSFLVTLKEEEKDVDFLWIEKFLDLQKRQEGLGLVKKPDLDHIVRESNLGTCVFPLLNQAQIVLNKDEVGSIDADKGELLFQKGGGIGGKDGEDIVKYGTNTIGCLEKSGGKDGEVNVNYGATTIGCLEKRDLINSNLGIKLKLRKGSGELVPMLESSKIERGFVLSDVAVGDSDSIDGDSIEGDEDLKVSCFFKKVVGDNGELLFQKGVRTGGKDDEDNVQNGNTVIGCLEKSDLINSYMGNKQKLREATGGLVPLLESSKIGRGVLSNMGSFELSNVGMGSCAGQGGNNVYFVEKGELLFHKGGVKGGKEGMESSNIDKEVLSDLGSFELNDVAMGSCVEQGGISANFMEKSGDSDFVDGDPINGDKDLKGVRSVDSLCSSNAKRSNKNPFPPRSHKMKTRSGARGFDSKVPIKSFGKENLAPEVKMVSWNLKEELAKVIKVGVEFGYDFKGREKETVEEIIMRIKAGSFGKLEGILPFKNK